MVGNVVASGFRFVWDSGLSLHSRSIIRAREGLDLLRRIVEKLSSGLCLEMADCLSRFERMEDGCARDGTRIETAVSELREELTFCGLRFGLVLRLRMLVSRRAALPCLHFVSVPVGALDSRNTSCGSLATYPCPASKRRSRDFPSTANGKCSWRRQGDTDSGPADDAADERERTAAWQKARSLLRCTKGEGHVPARRGTAVPILQGVLLAKRWREIFRITNYALATRRGLMGGTVPKLDTLSSRNAAGQEILTAPACSVDEISQARRRSLGKAPRAGIVDGELHDARRTSAGVSMRASRSRSTR